MKKLFSLALIATSVALLSACSPDEDNKVKVAINTGPDEAIWKVVEQVAKDKYHLDVEVVSFNDYVLPNEALNNKDKPEDAVLDVQGIATVTPAIVQACTQDKQANFKDKVKGEWDKIKKDM